MPDAERSLLVEREIEAILRFPDQNPNPVLRTSSTGVVLYANPASRDVLAAMGGEVGGSLPRRLFADILAAADARPAARVDVQVQARTIALLPVRVSDLDVVNIYGTDVTAENAVAKFPDQNPNPVLRIDAAGALIYANPASEGIVDSLGIRDGDRLPADLGEAIGRRLAGDSSELIEVRGDGRIYAITPVAVPEFGFTNLYGTDVTGLRAIDRFPNDNPNPVLRASRDGVLTYANPASEPVRRALGAEVGQPIPAVAWKRLAAASAADGGTLEVEWADRLYSLTVVSVYEFESVNIYGTDITAAREVERLLLNILPASIAGRLRAGERVIADRFDEMAVLFADIVNFTPFAQAHPPDEVVSVLNGVFSIFDELADHYGLEKIKTIGDAYMAVGGIQGDADGPERVARMGMDMIERLRDYRTPHGDTLEIRVGMHVGPVVGGVIGLKKFIYDVWGHTVNTASRMESHGLPGRLQVTESARERLAHAFAFEPRGTVEVKGVGPMQTYLLIGPAA
ncbi:MAG TPA: adenylate/guanylate cyclase domain-containing protein [Candidatus Limnocylindria bacterium]|nr:adenylate/guanylate cyclase domain-containing protein [Candidatus Limnocylindria bacterium]